MISYLLAGPAEEPVSLAEAKGFLRVDDEAEDGFIGTLVTAARIHLESVTGRALVEQSWRVVLDAWPEGNVVALPVGPFMALDAITAFDVDDEAHVVPLAQFVPESGRGPARLFLPAQVKGMPAMRQRLGIEIDYRAGYGADATAVPADLRQAVLSLVGHWFEHRDAVIIAGSGAVVPAGFDRLVAPYKRVRL
jgi:uncharacterized phiE125 gp8 family phage protein